MRVHHAAVDGVVNPVVIPIVAAAAATIGMFVLWRSAGEQRHEILRDAAWLLLALTPVLLLFSTFPESELSLTIRGVSASGAVALFVYVWRRGTQLARRGQALTLAHAELRQLRDRLTALDRADTPLAPVGTHGPLVARFRLREDRFRAADARIVGVFGGDVTDVDFVDVWVSSENVYMQMSRYFERTLSAVIRYGGAAKDDHGQPVDDAIGHELSQVLGDRSQVAPGAVLLTPPGALAATNHVRWILHVAAVYGEVGVGYRQIGDVGHCVDNALTRADHLVDSAGRAVGSVLLPLFGAGTGGGDTEATASVVVARAVRWLSRNPTSSINEVWLLGYTVDEFTALRQAVERSSGLEPAEATDAASDGTT